MRNPRSKKSIVVAVIGAGNMAREHIRAFSDIDDVIISGIYSRTRFKSEELAKKYAIKNVCDSIEELYLSTQADIVIIAISELAVYKVCLHSFRYSWICLIEKPAGHTLPQAQAIKDAAEKLGSRAYVALNRRHYGSTREVIKELEKVEGDRLVHIYDQENAMAALESGLSEELVKNWMYANSIHVVDFLRLFGRGTVTSIQPIIRWNPDKPKFVMAKIVFSSGDIGIYECIWDGPGPWAVTVTTQHKRWEMRPLEKASVQNYKSRILEQLPESAWDSEFKPGLRLQAEEAIRAFRMEDSLLPTLAESFETMKIIKSIYEL
jgi:predicted dehydrogenase